MKLKNCNIDDRVILWYIGLNCWDTEIVKIKNKFTFIDVEYENGHISRFCSSTKCKQVNKK